MNEINIYCDESCHLEHDRQTIMVIGGIWCSRDAARDVAKQIRIIKEKHNARGELKWVKVSKSRLEFYRELVHYFFDASVLNFRCLLVDDKSKLNHEYFNQGSHDSFYYKMYFYMLRNILKKSNTYNIYLDIKDTHGARKIAKLKEILCNNAYDFTQDMIGNIQNIRSNESDILQLADFFIGAISYCNRGLSGNCAKNSVIELIKQNTKHDLKHTTPPWEEKFNIFIFSPTEVR